MKKHTILGAGGSIGNSLTYELLKNKQEVRLVSRSGYSSEGTTSVKADLTSFEDTYKSIKGSDIVYLCAGLPYDYKIWKDQWPKIMKNTIDACIKANTKLIFFDNVYMYGKVEGKMTEETPYNPCSKKGEIRAQIDRMLEEQIDKKNIRAIIARSADLYGPYATKTSIPYVLVMNRLLNKKRPLWMVNAKVKHSFTNTLDCARGLYLLGSSDNNFNQVWHLPTVNEPINMEDFINILNKELNLNFKPYVLNKFIIKMTGIIDSTTKELYEMLYQFDSDYEFDSSKFNKHFNYTPISYKEGIKETIEFLNKVNKKDL